MGLDVRNTQSASMPQINSIFASFFCADKTFLTTTSFCCVRFPFLKLLYYLNYKKDKTEKMATAIVLPRWLISFMIAPPNSNAWCIYSCIKIDLLRHDQSCGCLSRHDSHPCLDGLYAPGAGLSTPKGLLPLVLGCVSYWCFGLSSTLSTLDVESECGSKPLFST